MPRGAMRRGAFTLLEIMIVVLIAASLAAATSLLPPGGSSRQKLDLAAEEVATALRHARSEAVRTGEAHGAAVAHLSGQVQVWKADLSTGLAVPESVLIDPFAKRPYDFRVGELPGAGGVRIANGGDPFLYQGLGAAVPGIVFDAQGFAFWLVGGVRYQLATGAVVLAHGDAERQVDVSRIGRVEVP